MAVPTSPNYPSSLDSQTSLFGFTNIGSYTLTGAISDTVDNFSVNELIVNFEVPGFLKFSSGETIYVEAKTEGTRTFSSVSRGVAGTTATTHSAGEEMRGILVAEILEQLRDAIIAIETEIGADPTLDATYPGLYTDVKDRMNTNWFEAANMNAESLAAQKNLVDGDASLQILTPSGNNRTVQLPAEAGTNHAFIIINPDATYTLTIQDDAPTTLETLIDFEAAFCFSDGTNGGWHTTKLGYNDTRFLALGRLVGYSGGTKTISTGAITVSPGSKEAFYIVAAESGTADDLDTISGGSDGDVIFLKADSGDTINLVSGTGSGKLTLDSNTVKLSGETILQLRHDGTDWSLVGGAGGGETTPPDNGTFFDLTNSYDTIINKDTGNTKKIEQIILQNTSATTTEFYIKFVQDGPTTFFEFYVQLAQYETFVLEVPIYLADDFILQAKTQDSITTGRIFVAYRNFTSGFTDFGSVTGTTYSAVTTVASGKTYAIEAIGIQNTYTASNNISFRVHDGSVTTKFEETRALSPGALYFVEYKFVIPASYTVGIKQGTAAHTAQMFVSYKEV